MVLAFIFKRNAFSGILLPPRIIAVFTLDHELLLSFNTSKVMQFFNTSSFI